MSRQGSLRRGAAALSLCLFRLARGEPEPEETVEVPEVVVRFTRLAAAADPTASATVVEADRFAGESKTVGELVGTAPGVAVNGYGGLGQLSTVSIRGSTADGVKVLLDGLPLNSAAGGGVDLSTIPRSWIERIEVVRGAEGARYGAGALGGVVNVITRRAAAGAWSAQLAGGSFTTGSAAADAALGGETWGALLALEADGTGGRFPYLFDERHDPTRSYTGPGIIPRERTHNAAASAGLLAKGWAMLADGRLDVMAQASGGERDLPGWPYAETPGDRQREGRLATVARYGRLVAPGLSLSTELGARAERLDTTMESLGGTVMQRDVAANARAEVAWTSGPSELRAGASAGGERLAADGLGPPRTRREVAAWLAHDLDLVAAGLRISPALRVEAVGPFTGVSGKLGASVRLLGPLAARVSGGRAFRPPSFAELYLQQGLLAPNPDLRSEESWSADASIQAEGPLGLASLGLFATLYQDLILYLPVSFQRMKAFNAGRAAARGIEAEVATAPVGALGASLSLAYTFLDTEILRGEPAEVGNQLPHRSRHRLFARASLAPGAWEAHAEAHWVGRQPLDTRNVAWVPAALVFNAGGSVRLLRAPEVRLGLEARNLADDRTLRDQFDNPLPGRMVLLALRVASNPEEGGRR